MDESSEFTLYDGDTPPHSAVWSARRRAASAMRALSDLLVTSGASAEQLEVCAVRVEQVLAELAQHARVAGRDGFQQQGGHGGFNRLGHELNAVAGVSNPVAAPLRIWVDGDQVRGMVTLGWPYEGAPGLAHGGIVSALFDQFLGTAQVIGKRPGMTGRLTVHFHAPTPLHTELALTATLQRVEGRKTLMRGEMTADGVLTASCEALFIRPRAGIPAPARPGDGEG